ncbi:MAG: glucose-6-phosphate isomerase, partial [Alphaproteobacteria bacterium]
MLSNPSTSPAWKNLQAHAAKMKAAHMRDLFAEDNNRFKKFHIQNDGILLDYSRHIATDETRNLLIDLAKT